VGNKGTYSIKQLIRLSGQKVLLPFYHLVTDKTPTFTKNLYPARNLSSFKNDLDVLLRYYTPISFEQLLEINTTGMSPEKPVFHLTFDDGLSNFYQEVAPILLEKKIPATLFVNTDFVDNKALFFRYKASLLMHDYTTAYDSKKKLYTDFVKKKSDKPLDSFLFSITYQNKETLDELAKLVEYSFDDFLKKEQPYLTTQQLKTLKTQGFCIGSHSVDHPLFEQLSLQEQLEQIEHSTSWLQKHLGTLHRTFSFPFEDVGVSKAFFEQADLELSFGTYGIKNDSIQNNLQRISFELAPDSIEGFIRKAYLRYFGKLIFRKHLIKRY